MQELKKLKSTKPSYIKEALRTVPETLDATYERMLTGIEKAFRKEALVLLRWLAYASSPPSLGELAEASIIDPANDGAVHVDDRGSLEDSLDILSGLVTIEGNDDDDNNENEYSKSDASDFENNDGKVTQSVQRIGKHVKIRLAHFSVQEYLESSRILQSNAKDFYLERGKDHRFLAQSCLVYIMHYSSKSDKASSERDLAVFPMLRYAARSWFSHSYLQEFGDVSREKFLLSSSNAKHDWLLIYQPDRPWKRAFDLLRDIGSGLYYASFLGLGAVADDFIKSGVDVNVEGGEYSTALQAASSRGHEMIVRMLIDAGADVNARGWRYGSALQAASSRGHERVCEHTYGCRRGCQRSGRALRQCATGCISGRSREGNENTNGCRRGR